MAEFYGRKIKSDIMMFDEVPSFWKARVELWLEENKEVM